MTLYRYVASRDTLLDAMVEALHHQLASTMSLRTRGGTTQASYLTETAHDVRDLALRHPWLIRLIVLRPAPARWLSQPLSSLACTATFLDALHRRGADLISSVDTYRGFNAFLLAHLLRESAASTQDPTGSASTQDPTVSASTQDPTVSASTQDPTVSVTSGELLGPSRHGVARPALMRYPVLARRQSLLAPDDPPVEFRRTLHLFVRSVDHQRPARRP